MAATKHRRNVPEVWQGYIPAVPRHSSALMKSKNTRYRILLVSRDHTVREALGDVLRSNGFEVLYAENGVNAVKTFVANAINAIVLDHQTPFDGLDSVGGRSCTLEALVEINPFLPVVLMQVRESELDHGSLLLADVVLTHPVPPSALLESIDALLTEPFTERVHRKSKDFTLIR